MKRLIFGIVAFFTVGVMTTWSQPAPGPGTNRFLIVAAVTVLLNGQTNPVTVPLTGDTVVRRGSLINSNQTFIVPVEILSLQLQGGSQELNPVGLVGIVDPGPPNLQANVGALVGGGTSAQTFFPADSFFDIFFQIDIGGSNGFSAINLDPLHIETITPKFPSTAATYTNRDQIVLYDGADTNVVRGTIIQLWLNPAVPAKEIREAICLSAVGIMSNGVPQMAVCTNAAAPFAVTKLVKQTFTNFDFVPVELCFPVMLAGGFTNHPCSEYFWPCDMDLVVTLNSNLKPPYWIGDHKGTWKLLCHGTTNVAARGQMEGTSGVGTHRLALGTSGGNETCVEPGHLEGKMKGVALDPGSGAKWGTIEASYAGWFFLGSSGARIHFDPPPPKPPSGYFAFTIDGVVIKPCPP